MLENFYYSSLRDVVSIYIYVFPALTIYLIFGFILLKLIWAGIYSKVIQQYKIYPSWIAFIPYGRYYFRLALKNKPLIVLFGPILTVPLYLWLFLMEISYLMILPAFLILVLTLFKYLVILSADRDIWNDFEIDGGRVWVSFVPVLGIAVYVVNTIRMAAAPELLHDFKEEE